jgi:hypothetical protein
MASSRRIFRARSARFGRRLSRSYYGFRRRWRFNNPVSRFRRFGSNVGSFWRSPIRRRASRDRVLLTIERYKLTAVSLLTLGVLGGIGWWLWHNKKTKGTWL